jgi:hypothetical protein
MLPLAASASNSVRLPWPSYIRIFADLMDAEEFHRVQVEYGKGVIFLASDEGEPIGLIERNAVRILDARQLVSTDDLLELA